MRMQEMFKCNYCERTLKLPLVVVEEAAACELHVCNHNCRRMYQSINGSFRVDLFISTNWPPH